MLQVRDLCVTLGGRQVLTMVDLDVAPGESLAIVGPSGSGKTTLVNAIAGITSLSSGRVAIRDVEATALSAARRARHRL